MGHLDAAIYNRLGRRRQEPHQHATRLLARARRRVIWRCWQDGGADNPRRHGGAETIWKP